MKLQGHNRASLFISKISILRLIHVVNVLKYKINILINICNILKISFTWSSQVIRPSRNALKKSAPHFFLVKVKKPWYSSSRIFTSGFWLSILIRSQVRSSALIQVTIFRNRHFLKIQLGMFSIYAHFWILCSNYHLNWNWTFVTFGLPHQNREPLSGQLSGRTGGHSPKSQARFSISTSEPHLGWKILIKLYIKNLDSRYELLN